MIGVGSMVRVGAWSTGRVVWVGSEEGDWKGYCTVAWGNGFTLEAVCNLRSC